MEDKGSKFRVATNPPESHEVIEEEGANKPGKIPQYTEVVKKKKTDVNTPKDYNKLQHTPELAIPPPPPSQLPPSAQAALQETYSALDCPNKERRGGPHYELCTGEATSPSHSPNRNGANDTDKIVYYNETVVKRAGK